METIDTVVIGAGVVGLAVARQLALTGREVLILEAEASFGTQTSARNSEVIHAGLYYPTGSLKARLCVAGKERLYRYCAERGVAHRRIGKLLVAADEAELPALASYARSGRPPTACRSSRSPPPRFASSNRRCARSPACTPHRPASSTVTA